MNQPVIAIHKSCSCCCSQHEKFSHRSTESRTRNPQRPDMDDLNLPRLESEWQFTTLLSMIQLMKSQTCLFLYRMKTPSRSQLNFLYINQQNQSVLHIFPYFPTCQVRVVRFYQSCSPPPPPHPPPPSPPPPPPRSPDPNRDFQIAVRLLLLAVQIPTATSRSQWALPDLHRERQIPAAPAGPPPRAPDPSGHCRTSTATSRLQRALPDLNRDFQIAVGTAGPQPRLPRTSTATSRSQWALPDLNGKNVRKDVR